MPIGGQISMPIDSLARDATKRVRVHICGDTDGRLPSAGREGDSAPDIRPFCDIDRQGLRAIASICSPRCDKAGAYKTRHDSATCRNVGDMSLTLEQRTNVSGVPK